MMTLAPTYREQARLKVAQQLYMTVLEFYQRVLGEENINTMTCMFLNLDDLS